MKILHVPERPVWAPKITCTNNECNAVLELAAEDVFRDSYRNYYARCEACTTHIALNPEELAMPPYVQTMADDHRLSRFPQGWD